MEIEEVQEITNNDLGSAGIMKNKFKLYITPVLAIIGILISMELIIVYFRANFGIGSASSFCDFNDVINCDAVARTTFSHFLGIPLALYGLGFYFVILFLSLLNYIKDKGIFKNPNSYIYSLSTIALFVSLILIIISLTQIHKICVLCYITYFINLFLLFAAKSGKSSLSHYQNTLNDLKSALIKPVYAVSTVIILVLIATMLFFVNKYDLFIPNDINNPFFKYSETSSDLNAGVGMLGSKNPKVIINEYTDFQCPYCAMSNVMLHRLVQEFDGVAVIHHDYPLDKVCNKAMTHSGHQNSCLIAQYSRAAKIQNKYWQFNSLLYDNQEDITEVKVIQLAKKIGLNTDKLKKDAKSPEIRKQLINDVNEANKIGISSTPTYIIGMKVYKGLMTYHDLKKIVIKSGARSKLGGNTT